uniref:Uncharacterized protein n=1 Tax=Anguilla anguilla TaxID=7936 RepID=A0A0E9RYV4_ANGAN
MSSETGGHLSLGSLRCCCSFGKEGRDR